MVIANQCPPGYMLFVPIYTVHPAPPPLGTGRKRTHISLLYVDDSPSMLEIMKIILEKDFCVSVRTCQCPLTALQMLTEEEFDLIISDYDMPRMDGLKFLLTIRSRGLSTPFVLYTCHSLDEIRDETHWRDSVHYVHKWGSLYDQITHLKTIIQNSISFSFQEYQGVNLII